MKTICKDPSVCLLVFGTAGRKTHCYEYCMTQVNSSSVASSEEKFVLRRTVTTPVVTTSLCAAASWLCKWGHVTTLQVTLGTLQCVWCTPVTTKLQSQQNTCNMRVCNMITRWGKPCIHEIKGFLHVTLFTANNNEYYYYYFNKNCPLNECCCLYTGKFWYFFSEFLNLFGPINLPLSCCEYQKSNSNN